MSGYWIVVASAGRARFFEAKGKDCVMNEIMTLTNPYSRQHEGDLVSDKQGRAANSATGAHSVGGEKDAKQHEAEVFAKTVCEELEKGRNDNAYGEFYLIAPPQFLGLLRQHMSKPLANLVGATFAKDLTLASEDQIRARLV